MSEYKSTIIVCEHEFHIYNYNMHGCNLSDADLKLCGKDCKYRKEKVTTCITTTTGNDKEFTK